MQDEGRVVIITGAASGIGLECALAFGARGANVAIFDVDETGGQHALALMAGNDAVAAFFKVDVSEEEEVKSAVMAVRQRFGRIDVLVNCAAIQILADIRETSILDLDRLYRMNLRGPFLCSRECLPHLSEAGNGAIVNIGSVLGLVGDPLLAGYGAMKGAIIALTKSCAMAWGHLGVRVNCLCPGDVNTPMVERYFANSEDPETLRRSVASNYALGRIAEPAEIAEAVCFLASPSASFFTGSIVIIDGGLTSKCY